MLAGLRKTTTNFHKIWWNGGTWTAEESVRFWWWFWPIWIMLH